MIFGFIICLISGYGILQKLTEDDIKYTIEVEDIDKTNLNDFDMVKLKLTEALIELCNQFDIKLVYIDDLDIVLNCSGCIWYGIIKRPKIAILTKYKNEPAILAHELGHYIANKQRHDRSELSADREGLKLCQSILTFEEQKILSYLTKYFSRYETR
jgi:hypothetical protein